MRYRPRRMPSRYEAVAELHGETRRVKVLDVSGGGACLSGAQGLLAGMRCALRVTGDVLTATVRWTSEDQAGISFDHALTPRQLDILRGSRRPSPAGRSARRTFAFAEIR